MRSVIAGAIVLSLVPRVAPAASNLDHAHPFAWGENFGWTNWHDANGGASGVCVGGTFLGGYTWGENVGWINVGNGTPANGTRYANADDTDFGVNMNADGTLAGLAWGENIGWINFAMTSAIGAQGARFDTAAHRFRGFAWGENVGWINLDDDAKFVGTQSPASSDLDGDADVDLDDFQRFQSCFNGPNRAPAPTDCGTADFDGDLDVDLDDFQIFQGCFNGPNRPPACV